MLLSFDTERQARKSLNRIHRFLHSYFVDRPFRVRDNEDKPLTFVVKDVFVACHRGPKVPFFIFQVNQKHGRRNYELFGEHVDKLVAQYLAIDGVGVDFLVGRSDFECRVSFYTHNGNGNFLFPKNVKKPERNLFLERVKARRNLVSRRWRK